MPHNSELLGFLNSFDSGSDAHKRRLNDWVLSDPAAFWQLFIDGGKIRQSTLSLCPEKGTAHPYTNEDLILARTVEAMSFEALSLLLQESPEFDVEDLLGPQNSTIYYVAKRHQFRIDSLQIGNFVWFMRYFKYDMPFDEAFEAAGGFPELFSFADGDDYFSQFLEGIISLYQNTIKEEACHRNRFRDLARQMPQDLFERFTAFVHWQMENPPSGRAELYPKFRQEFLTALHAARSVS